MKKNTRPCAPNRKQNKCGFESSLEQKKIIRQKNLLKTFNNGILNSVNP